MKSFHHLIVKIIIPISSIILLSVCVSCVSISTSVPERPRIHYIVPDEYKGYVAIHFNCTEGKPILLRNNIYTINFDDNGILCTNSPPFDGLFEEPTAETRSGKVVPEITETQAQSFKGHALCCMRSLTIGGGTQENPGAAIQLELGWIGDIQQYKGVSEDEYIQFFITRFGLKDVRLK